MFFFFAGGLEKRAGRVLAEGAGRCIRCGSVADLVEVEKVLRLFFVPVRRWPSRDPPALSCRSCSLLFPQQLSSFPTGLDHAYRPSRCQTCDRDLDPDFRFCPFCGTAL